MANEVESKENSSRPTESVSISDKEAVVKSVKASGFSVFWMGICVVLGGQTISWNAGLHMGYWEFFIATLLLGLAYICLTLCLAEIASILPFAGGSYGYVRCSLGPPVGFMVGFAEAVEYIVYTSAAVVVVGELFHDLFHASYSYLPLYWLLFYALAVPLHILGGPYAWNTAVVVGVLTVCTVAAWCLMDVDHENIGRYTEEEAVGGRAKTFMHYFPYAAWFYKGIEVMTLTSRNSTEPTKTVPTSMLRVMGTVYFSSICVLLTAGAAYPGPSHLAEDDRTFDPLVIHVLHVTRQVAALFMLPGALGSAFGFMFAFSQQLHSMANSGLLCGQLRMVYGPYATPYVALLVGSLLSYLCVLVLYYSLHNLEEVVHDLFDICLLASCSVDISIFAAYHIFRSRYSGLERSFSNPLGYFAVGYGVLSYSFLAIAIAFFSKDEHIAIIVFVCLMLAGFLWYMTIARKTEFFSKEEQDQFMKAYVLNANAQKKKKQRGNSKSHRSARFFGYFSRFFGTTGTNNQQSPSMMTSNQQKASSSHAGASVSRPPSRSSHGQQEMSSGGAGK